MSHSGSQSLEGRVALVTGSSRGLGKEMALELARRGARVAMNYGNSRETGERGFADLQMVSKESCLVAGDVTDEATIKRICREVAERLGPIDILVPNATCDQPQLPIEEYDLAFFQRMWDFFVKSPVLLIKECLPHMKRQRWGRIINITSEVFPLGVPNFSAYVSAKGGQIGLSRSLVRELAPFGVTVNMVAPGWIPTERHENDPQEMKDDYVSRVPAGHFGTPDDVAGAVAYLASNAAKFVTGQTITVSGGVTVH